MGEFPAGGGSNPLVRNTIIWNNIPHQIFIDGPADPIVNYCDIQGHWPGEGNIDLNPKFRDPGNGDFRLKSSDCGYSQDSPCIDAGDPTISDSLLDCSWGLGMPRSDMGAYGGGDSTLQSVEDQFPAPDRFTLLLNDPNPFNARTTISYVLPAQSDISISIYNILGQQVETLFAGIKQAGAHTMIWNSGDHPSGVYFARLETGNYSKNIKMVLLK